MLTGSLYRSPPSPSTISADKLTGYEGAWVSPSGMHGAELHCFLTVTSSSSFSPRAVLGCWVSSEVIGACRVNALPLSCPYSALGFYLRWGLAAM